MDIKGKMPFKFIVILTVFCSFCFVSQSNEIHDDGLDQTKLIGTEEFLKSKKPIKQNKNEHITNLRNTTVESVDNNEELYGAWSKWSHCRKCKKFRRKTCISPKCRHVDLYEERPCRTPRCKRKKNRRKHKSKIIKKKQSRNIKESDDLYHNWSEWSACSHQCITWRQRYCRLPGTCLHDRDVEMGYCYRENTPCHMWIQSILNRQRQAQNRKYTYETDLNGKKRKKLKYKSRKCGIPYRTKKRGRSNMLKIMGGHVAKKKRWPWHVALLNYNKEVFCGGTLISPDWVLTAAHCLRRTLYVRLNEFDISYSDGTEIEYRIVKMYRHPKYDKSIIDNDIAMLKLPKSVPLPYACLPKNMSLPTGQNCTIVGWGKTSPYDYIGSSILREAQIPIVEKSICERSYRFYDITENMFCAGYKHGGTDTCSGDSGGGFMCLPQGKRFGWTVQGITSFGESCGKRSKYGIYTDVRKYLTWIQNKL